MNGRSISKIRNEIDNLDRQMVEILNQRAGLATEIGRWKHEQGLPVMDLAREREVLDRLCTLSDGTISDQGIRNIMTEVISACRSVQQPIKVAFLGPESTYTHAAAMNHFGNSVEYLARGSIGDIFKEVEEGLADYGVVPAENSTEGTISITLDRLANSNLKICGEIYENICHALLATNTDIKTVKKVVSHPQALAQCRGWLDSNLPDQPQIEAPSTGAAAEMAVNEPGIAAIGGILLAEKYGLHIIAQAIQDAQTNQTRFMILGNLVCASSRNDKTSICFGTSHQPGALAGCLIPFERLAINMTRIESRPRPSRPWEYLFFMDIEGHVNEPTVVKALEELSSQVSELKILGSYHRGEPILPKAIDRLGQTLDQVPLKER